MAATFTETAETRLYFNFMRGDETASRYLSIPGMPIETTSTVLQNFYKFRTYVLANMNQFVQPATWRDSTGSSSEDVETPWTTSDVQLEFYKVSRTRYDGEDT